LTLSLVRRYRLSARAGEGVRCDINGVFVGDVPLLERSGSAWRPCESAELSVRLSDIYGLPVDMGRKAKGLSACARALNKGDVARAQLVALHLQLPDPLPLAKSAPSPGEIENLVLLLGSAGLLKINSRHWPAGTPDSKGGQFAPKDADLETSSDSKQQQEGDAADDLNFVDDPTRDSSRASRAPRVPEDELSSTGTEAAEEVEARTVGAAGTRAAVRAAALSEMSASIRRAARRIFRKAALEALEKVGTKLALNEIPVVGLIADVSTIYDIYRFAKEFAELRTEIKAATRFVNEGAHTLAQLRASQETMVFPDFPAFAKITEIAPDEEELEKRFGPAGPGMEWHHIIERGSGAATNMLESTDNIIRIPTILHEEITARFLRKEARFGGLSLRDWLRTQPASVKREWGFRVLREAGIIVDGE